jgi:hypothetical protein
MQRSMPTRGVAAAPVFILGKPRIKIDRLWGLLLGMISPKELLQLRELLQFDIISPTTDGPGPVRFSPMTHKARLS